MRQPPPFDQPAYETALGQFLLEFNFIEVMIGDMVFRLLDRAGLEELGRDLASSSSFDRRLHMLKLLAKDVGIVGDIQHERLRKLLMDRNAVAHGHVEFDQATGGAVRLGRGVRIDGVSHAALQALTVEARSCVAALSPVYLAVTDAHLAAAAERPSEPF